MGTKVNGKKMTSLHISLHKNIHNGKYDEIKSCLDSNQIGRHCYNDDRESAAAVALKQGRVNIYELLVSRGLCFGLHEDMHEIVKDFSVSTKRKIQQIHKSHCKDPTLNHIRKLCAKIKLNHDSSDEDRREYFMRIFEAFEVLNEIEGMEPILKIVASAEDLNMMFDFYRTSIEHMDPCANKHTLGMCYPSRGDIYIGAKKLFANAEDYGEALGVMIHELCHYAMKLTYDNNCEPYIKSDEEEKRKFTEVLSLCEVNKDEEPQMEVVYRYPEHQKKAELIARVPHFMAMYKHDPQHLRECRETFIALFDYFEQKTLEDLKRELTKHEARQKLNDQSSLLSNLKRSENYLKHFDVELVDQNCQMIISNCPQVTVHAIYHHHRDDVNFHSKFLFVNLDDLRDVETFELILKALSLLTKPKLIVSCDDRENTDLLNIAKKLQEFKINQRIVFVANDITFSQALAFEFDRINVNHCLSQFTDSYRNKLLAMKINFQGKEINLHDLMDYASILKSETIPIKKYFAKQRIEIVKELKFEEIDIFIARNLLPPNAQPIENPLTFKSKKYKVEYDAEKVIKTTRKHQAILISDEPGVGKTTEMKMFAKRLKEKYPRCWVVFMDLKSFSKSYEKDGKVCQTFEKVDDVVQYFCAEILHLKTFESEVFANLFKDNRIILLMDGFDEICPSYKQFIMNLMTGIKRVSKNQLWISTRPHMATALKDLLKPITFQLKPFTKSNRQEYFEAYFRNEDIDEQLRQDMVQNVEQFLRSLRSKDILNPLLFQMLAKLYKDNSFNFSNSNQYSVYEEIARTMISHCMDKGPDAREAVLQTVGDTAITIFYYEKAFEVILPEFNSKFSQLEIFCGIPINNDFARIGLMYSDGESYHFLHRTFAEFYVARFIFEKIFLQKYQSKVELKIAWEIFAIVPSEDQYKVVASFLDSALNDYKTICSIKTINSIAQQTFSQSKFDNFLPDLVLAECLNIIEAISQFKAFKGLWKRSYESYDKQNILMITTSRSLDFVRGIYCFYERFFGTSTVKKMLLETSDTEQNIMHYAALSHLMVFDFFFAKIIDIFNDKQIINVLTAKDNMSRNVCVQHYITYSTDLDSEIYIFKILKEKLNERLFKDLIVSLGSDTLRCATCPDEMKYLLQTLSEIFIEPNEFKEFFKSKDHRKALFLHVSARWSDNLSFQVFWEFLILNFGQEDQNKMLMFALEGETALHCAMINNDSEILHFVHSLYKQRFGREKIDEILNTKVHGSSILMYAINVNLNMKREKLGSFESLTTLCLKNQPKENAMIDGKFFESDNILMHAARKYPRDIFVHFSESIKQLYDNQENWKKILREESHLEETVFHCAMENDDEETFEFVKILYQDNLRTDDFIRILKKEMRQDCNILTHAITCKSFGNFFSYLEQILSVDDIKELIEHVDSFGNLRWINLIVNDIKKAKILWRWIEKHCSNEPQQNILMYRNIDGSTVLHYTITNSDSFDFFKDIYKKVLAQDTLRKLIACNDNHDPQLFTEADCYQDVEHLEKIWNFIESLFLGHEEEFKKSFFRKESLLVNNIWSMYMQNCVRSNVHPMTSFLNSIFTENEMLELRKMAG